MSESLANPQIEPADHCWTIIQDHGPTDGGWGPAAVQLPSMRAPAPIAYTGSSEVAIEALKVIARRYAQDTGKATRLVRYTHREDVFIVAGSS